MQKTMESPHHREMGSYLKDNFDPECNAALAKFSKKFEGNVPQRVLDSKLNAVQSAVADMRSTFLSYSGDLISKDRKDIVVKARDAFVTTVEKALGEPTWFGAMGMLTRFFEDSDNGPKFFIKECFKISMRG